VIPCLDPLEALNWQRQRMYTQLGEVYLSDLGLEDDGMIVIAETFANGATNLRVPDLEGSQTKAASTVVTCARSFEVRDCKGSFKV
jgi:hypothetical protein